GASALVADRLPFDPSRIRAPAKNQAKKPPSVLSVQQLSALVREALSRHIPATVQVLGEIGDISRPASGHLYFTLKDNHAELRCVMWRSSATKLKFELEAGMQVIATGGIEVYQPRGTYQLIARRLEPRGVGALELAFRQLREKLASEGLFDAQRKKPLPAVPFRVALVTSPSGAALRDMLRTFHRRFPALDILIFPVRVQGEGAAREIADAVRDMNRHARRLGGIDVAIVARGGGSLEDLWAFNEEVVARAIAASAIPIVSAVGHEVDVTICDLVADLRAATPTAGAECITPTMTELIEALAALRARATRITSHALELAQHRLDAATAADWLARPLLRLRERAQWLDEWRQRVRHAIAEQIRTVGVRLARIELSVARFGSADRFARIARRLDAAVHRLRWYTSRRTVSAERRLASGYARLQGVNPSARKREYEARIRHVDERLSTAMRTSLARYRASLESRTEALTACDPQRILRRGYSITRVAKGKRILRSVNEIGDGMRIITQLADGEFRSTADDPRQPGLFDQQTD
ncbi:MAG: exodeoxyribonuclease VII large subunit, partial [Planctomycetes bacterium]|nr:exodeoxyribonuclease VII large subunit [Planctomycetota bacterium]